MGGVPSPGMLDVEDGECLEVTHMEEDDTNYEHGTVFAVTEMAVQRGTKNWFSVDADKAETHGQDLLVSSRRVESLSY